MLATRTTEQIEIDVYVHTVNATTVEHPDQEIYEVSIGHNHLSPKMSAELYGIIAGYGDIEDTQVSFVFKTEAISPTLLATIKRALKEDFLRIAPNCSVNFHEDKPSIFTRPLSLTSLHEAAELARASRKLSGLGSVTSPGSAGSRANSPRDDRDGGRQTPRDPVLTRRPTLSPKS